MIWLLNGHFCIRYEKMYCAYCFAAKVSFVQLEMPGKRSADGRKREVLIIWYCLFGWKEEGGRAVQHTLSALAPFILGRIEVLIYRYIEHCHHLIKGVEAGVLAIILVIHDGARSPVNNIGQLLLRHPAGLPRSLDGESYIVKIKSSFISFIFIISPNVIPHFR